MSAYCENIQFHIAKSRNKYTGYWLLVTGYWLARRSYEAREVAKVGYWLAFRHDSYRDWRRQDAGYSVHNP
jgi:hypothetical protein